MTHNHQQYVKLRNRKLGVLLYDARIAFHKSIEQCAEMMGVSPQTYQSYENGQIAPSLPEVEAFSFSLNIPLEHFWSNHSLSEKKDLHSPLPGGQLQSIRNRIIGTRLRMARMDADISAAELAEILAVDEEAINAFETGQEALPLPYLETLMTVLKLRIEEFFDQNGPIGNWRTRQTAIEEFMELPPEIREFICKPVNRPYLTLAIHLSELSTDKLRSIAEGLLEITY